MEIYRLRVELLYADGLTGWQTKWS